MQHSKLVNAISNSYRRKRFLRFLDLLQIQKHHSILDVGGSAYFWLNSGLEHNVTILNIELPANYPEPFTWVEGDACNMSGFADQSFDIVFSNSVIEHVGAFDRQRQMANEIQRVGKKYWVQTPYKHFPIEPHFIFPFFQYLPQSMRFVVAKIWPLSFAKRQGRDATIDAGTIWLLDYRQLHALFPNAQIEREKLFGLTKSLLIFKSDVTV